MKRPIVNKCCCCLSLSGGAQFLGWLNVLVGGIGMIMTILALVTMDETIPVPDGDISSIPILFPTLPGNLTINLPITVLTEQLGSIYKNSMIVSVITSLVAVAFAVCLIVGARKNNEQLVLPWLIGYMISIVVSATVVTLLLVVVGFLALALFPILAFQIYLWICVYSLYRDIHMNKAMVNESP